MMKTKDGGAAVPDEDLIGSIMSEAEHFYMDTPRGVKNEDSRSRVNMIAAPIPVTGIPGDSRENLRESTHRVGSLIPEFVRPTSCPPDINLNGEEEKNSRFYSGPGRADHIPSLQRWGQYDLGVPKPVVERAPKTPLEMIQNDFPSTSSLIFEKSRAKIKAVGSGIKEKKHGVDEIKSDEVPVRNPFQKYYADDSTYKPFSATRTYGNETYQHTRSLSSSSLNRQGFGRDAQEFAYTGRGFNQDCYWDGVPANPRGALFQRNDERNSQSGRNNSPNYAYQFQPYTAATQVVHPKASTAVQGANGTTVLNERPRSAASHRNSKTKSKAKYDRTQETSQQHSTSQSRHALLQELRVNKGSANFTLNEVIVKNLVSEFATDQNGSRFIQQSLECASKEEKRQVFEQLEPEIMRLCVDVFGNYVIQKFFEFGLREHRDILVQKLVGNVLPLTLQMYGCRVIQKALEVIEEDQQFMLINELKGHVMKCVKDQNGNHVIQKCIEKVYSKHIDFVVEAFIGQVYNLSTHAYGCRVIQRLLEYCGDNQKIPIFDEILARVLDLVTDQYGNYVIQHVLQRGAPAYRSAIVRVIQGHVLDLSKHKFASNVIEKCFAYAADKEKGNLVNEIIGDHRMSPVAEMVKDQYANYVVQKVLGVVNEDQRDRIIETIRIRVPNLRKITYGKHIVARVEKLTGKVL